MSSTISIESFDGILETLQGKSVDEVYQGNATLLWSVKHSLRDNKKLLDFEDTIGHDDIVPIVAALRNIGFTEFTISARQENLIEVLAEFQKLGVKVKGIKEFVAHRKFINGKERCLDFDAILMQIEPVNQSTAQKLRNMWCEGYNKIVEAADAAEEAINDGTCEDEVALEDLKTTLETCEAVIRTVEGD